MLRRRRSLSRWMLDLTQVYGYGLRMWPWDLWPSILPEGRFIGYVAQDLATREPHGLLHWPPSAA